MLDVLLPETPIAELIARGSAVYLIVAMVIRIIPKRHAGNLSPNDLVALVTAGSLAGGAIMGDATKPVDVVLMVVVVLSWDYVLNVLEYHFPRFRRIAQHTPTLVIHKGKVIEENLRREKLTEEELSASLRKQGIDDVARVRQAVLEVDGEVSVIVEGEDSGTRRSTR